ncbi:glycosyltransferase, partial [candidate division KSB1 bacterium]|nr:glycosyltransferase [candidate division KSB1 bacterium]NIR73267.1 glycosyltransferase [candidate division KSB1 bacterium]NIS26973.1 glycosyltransferase [candidate division KSB1 bacterium]NIT73812.1 glycosyltransferase [candidate division KSB1 bacterium]NIU27717.1 glycosyltransferase [candidate division KSB1 bacterium]
ESGRSQTQPSVSVIIAARNEDTNIASCVNAVLNQRYPRNKLEIIVVDDRSDDVTAEMVNQFRTESNKVTLLQIRDRTPHLAPKKRAIDLGIRNATGDIIVTTDADCRPGPLWIAELVKYFEPDVGMVAGFNPYRTEGSQPSLFQKMLGLDYFAMACVAAASTGLRFPISCSGGNLAYRKRLYFELGGFSKISNWISGDDDFFLEQVRDRTDWKIRFATHPDTFVPTAPPQNFSEFLNQRIRYASKTRHYKTAVTFGLVGIYFLNALLVVGPLFSLFSLNLLLAWIVAFGIKSLSEYAFLAKGQISLKFKWNKTAFLLAALLHPIYVSIVALLGQFFSFRWKGEVHSAKLYSREASTHGLNA